MRIIRSHAADVPAITDFLQPIYAATYPNDKYGLRAEHMSAAAFASRRNQDYLRDIYDDRADLRALLALDGDTIVGSISICRRENCFDFRGFYVAVERQGHGIGTKLMAAVLDFYDGSLPIELDVSETRAETIALYERWGFRRRADIGVKLRRWDEWPAEITNGYLTMELSAKNAIILKNKLEHMS